MVGQQLELPSASPRGAVQTVMFTPESEMPRQNLEDDGVDSWGYLLEACGKDFEGRLNPAQEAWSKNKGQYVRVQVPAEPPRQGCARHQRAAAHRTW